MNYIIMYGEFKYPLYESFNRWGGRIDFPRNYLTVPPKTSIRNIDTETIFTGIDLNSYSNSKLIMDMETAELLEMKAEQLQKQKYEELSINKNENEISSVLEQSNNITTINVQPNEIVSIQNSVVSITPSNKEVRKKVVDVVLRNLKNVLEDNNNNNNNNNNNSNNNNNMHSNELVLNLIKKIKQFGKEKQLDKMDQNSKRLISTNFANLIDLTESNITESPNKKSKNK